MLNRREFVYGTVASVLTCARGPAVFAADYDLIIKGGRVIDPSLHVNAVRDVAVSGGRITSVAANIDGSAAEVIDATGKLVVPGLLDVHCHYGRDDEGPHIGLSDGVTGGMSVRCLSGEVPDTCPVKEAPVFTDSIRISQLSAGRMSDECPVRVSGHVSGDAFPR